MLGGNSNRRRPHGGRSQRGQDVQQAVTTRSSIRSWPDIWRAARLPQSVPDAGRQPHLPGHRPTTSVRRGPSHKPHPIEVPGRSFRLRLHVDAATRRRAPSCHGSRRRLGRGVSLETAEPLQSASSPAMMAVHARAWSSHMGRMQSHGFIQSLRGTLQVTSGHQSDASDLPGASLEWGTATRGCRMTQRFLRCTRQPGPGSP